MSAHDRLDPMGAGAVARKLHAARARLVLERPFLGALALHLELHAGGTRSIGTDGRRLAYDARFVAGLGFAETQFMVAHAALHCALGHLVRRHHRDRARWDAACDFAVNQLLVDDGLPAPPGALLDAAYRGLAAEEIYPLLPQNVPATLDEHGTTGEAEAGGGASIGRDTSPGARAPLADATFMEAHRDGFDEIAMRVPAQRLADVWRDRLSLAASEAAQAGRLGSPWHGLLAHLAQPRLPWRALLERFLVTHAQEDYSFARPSRREGAAILPGRAGREATLVVALDTSGSIGRELLLDFAGEVDALKGRLNARVAVLFCDAALSADSPLRFEPWEPIRFPEVLAGGGSTRFAPVFDWIAREPVRPDALVYFTDGLAEFAQQPPDYPVLWIVSGNAQVPWGTRVQLN
jgi:predicted metal-dependent peptidase